MKSVAHKRVGPSLRRHGSYFTNPETGFTDAKKRRDYLMGGKIPGKNKRGPSKRCRHDRRVLAATSVKS